LAAIFSFFMDNVYFGAINKHLVVGDVPTYVFLSLIPNLGLVVAVCWFFSPMRKFQYVEQNIDISTTGSSARRSQTSGVGTNNSFTQNSDKKSSSIDDFDPVVSTDTSVVVQSDSVDPDGN